MAHLIEQGYQPDGSWNLNVLITDLNIQRFVVFFLLVATSWTCVSFVFRYQNVRAKLAMPLFLFIYITVMLIFLLQKCRRPRRETHRRRYAGPGQRSRWVISHDFSKTCPYYDCLLFHLLPSGPMPLFSKSIHPLQAITAASSLQQKRGLRKPAT